MEEDTLRCNGDDDSQKNECVKCQELRHPLSLCGGRCDIGMHPINSIRR